MSWDIKTLEKWVRCFCFFCDLSVYRPRAPKGDAVSASVATSGTTNVLLLKLECLLNGKPSGKQEMLFPLHLMAGSYLPKARINALRLAFPLRFTASLKWVGLIVIFARMNLSP